MNRTKVILSVLATLALAGQSWALEIDLSKIKVDGMLELRGHAANNETDFSDKANDARSVTRHRITLGVGGALTEGVMARVEAVRKPTGGATLAAFGTTGIGQFGAGPQTVQGEQANLTLENAYLSIDDVIWGIGAKIGRMYWGSKNSLVGFAGHWDDDNLTTTGIDAIALHHKCGQVDVNYTQATLADTKAIAAVDSTVTKVYLKSLGAMVNIKDLSGNDKADVPVALTIHNATSDGATGASGDNVNLGIIELNAGADLMDKMVHLGLDWGSNSGQRNVLSAGAAPSTVKFKGSLMALRGEVNHEESGFGGSLEIANASGDDNNQEPDGTAAASGVSADDKSWHDLSAFGIAPYRHYGQIVGKSNTMAIGGSGLDSGTPLTGAGAAAQGRGLNLMVLGVNYRPMAMDKKWKFGLDYITAKSNKVRPATAVAAGSGLGASSTDAATLSKDIGSEIDLSANYMKSENVMFQVGYAQFSPKASSAQLGNGILDDKVTKMFANASVKF